MPSSTARPRPSLTISRSILPRGYVAQLRIPVAMPLVSLLLSIHVVTAAVVGGAGGGYLLVSLVPGCLYIYPILVWSL